MSGPSVATTEPENDVRQAITRDGEAAGAEW